MKKKTRGPQGMGSIYQRASDGFWVASMHTGHDDKGRATYRRVYRKNHSDILEAMKGLRKQVDSGKPIQTDKITVSAFLDQWLRDYVTDRLAPKTQKYYTMMVEGHLKPTLGRTELRKLTAGQVQALITSKSTKPINDKGRKLKGNTVAGIRRTLRTALGKAYNLGLVAENVATRTEAVKVATGEAVYLSVEQVQALRAKMVGHQLENLVNLAVGTGLRIGEATGLRWDDVDLEAGTLNVRVQLQRVGGKLVLRGLKSKSSQRNLALVGWGLEAIQAEQFRQASLKAKLGDDYANPMGLVFLNSEGRPFDGKFVDVNLKRLCEKAEIPAISFHKLRHSSATLLLASGETLSNVKDMLGHSSISLTSNTYGHAVPTALKSAAERLDAMLKTEKTS